MKNSNNLKEQTNNSTGGKIETCSEAILVVKKSDLIEFAKVCNVMNTPPIKQEPSSVPNIEKPIPQIEAVKFFGKSRQTLINWIKKGLIKAYKISGRIYYKPSELLEALEELE